MNFDWDKASQQTVAHYRELVRQYPAQVDAWREQCRRLEREHPVFEGLETKVREALKA